MGTAAGDDRLCLIIDATRAGEFELFQFNAITRACGDLADVYLVTNRSDRLIGPRHLNVADAEIFDPDNNHKKARKVVPGNPDLKLLALLARPEMAGYERFLRMEFDCVFSHDIARTVARLDELSRSHDLGYSSSFQQKAGSGWSWWRTVENWRDPDLQPPGPLHGAFLPVLMFNRRFIACYVEALREGWRGHYEALVPSIARWRGLSAIDFGKSRDFHIAKPVFTVHRPDVFDVESTQFFHPIKGFDALKRLPSRVLANYAPHAREAAKTWWGLVEAYPPAGAEMDLIQRVLRDAHRLLCYGAPGVVEVAAAHGLQRIWFLTSDRREALAVADYPQLEPAQRLGNLRIEFVNLGRTAAYGMPVKPVEAWKFVRYLRLPPEAAPDTVVISGRFRVAMAANLYLHAAGNADIRVIVPNFTSREHYAPILDLYEPVEKAGDTVRLSALAGREDRATQILEAHREDPR